MPSSFSACSNTLVPKPFLQREVAVAGLASADLLNRRTDAASSVHTVTVTDPSSLLPVCLRAVVPCYPSASKWTSKYVCSVSALN